MSIKHQFKSMAQRGADSVFLLKSILNEKNNVHFSNGDTVVPYSNIAMVAEFAYEHIFREYDLNDSYLFGTAEEIAVRLCQIDYAEGFAVC